MKKVKFCVRHRSADRADAGGVENGKFVRSGELAIERRDDGFGAVAKVVSCSVSSETPYPRRMWDTEAKEYVKCYEVLGHGEGEIDNTRMRDGLVIQDDHGGEQIGIMDAPAVRDGKLCGTIRFGHSQRAKDIEADALDGIRKNMSVGYIVKAYEKTGTAEDGLPIFRVTKWMPFEASFVNVPADTNVGVGRADSAEAPELPAVETKHEGAAVSPIAVETKEKSMNPEQIAALCEKAERAGMKAGEVFAMVKEQKSYEDVCGAIAERAVENAEKAEQALANAKKAGRMFDEGDTKKIERHYNILNVIRALSNDGHPDVGFERELSDEIAKQTGKSARGFFIPEAALRTMTGKTNVASHITGNGAALVQTSVLTDQYIDALVGRTVLGAAGVQTLGGLVGDIALPKGTSVSAGWLSAEDGTATTAAPAFSQVTGTPHSIAANTILSRKIMLQTAGGVQNLVTRLIVESIARGVETAAFEGSGSSGQPTGLANTSSVGSVEMVANAPTKANMVDFWKTVLAANAGTDSLKYIMSPAVKALLCKTLDLTKIDNGKTGDSKATVGGVAPGYLCSREGKVEGYDVLMSGLCDATKIYFGNWSDLILAFWSGIDLTVDPYTYSANGAVQVTAFQDCDILVRHPQAFAIGTAAS